jgi:hypothetical protein
MERPDLELLRGHERANKARSSVLAAIDSALARTAPA